MSILTKVRAISERTVTKIKEINEKYEAKCLVLEKKVTGGSSIDERINQAIDKVVPEKARPVVKRVASKYTKKDIAKYAAMGAVCGAVGAASAPGWGIGMLTIFIATDMYTKYHDFDSDDLKEFMLSDTGMLKTFHDAGVIDLDRMKEGR